MTERLYYDDSYMTEFDAEVRSCEGEGGAYSVILDRTAFYPTSGGQGHDTGEIGDAKVVDVNVVDGDVVHTVDAPLEPGARVHCRIDWARRFDHMQQHAADHLIAGLIHRRCGGYTVGLHLGHDLSTIDVVMKDGEMRLTDEQILEIERLANEDIQRNLPVRCFFPTDDEMAGLPLRKDPTVSEHVRVVMIGDEECVACGGTHVEALGQIGLVKILWTAPSRGKLRLAFVAGMRAVGDYQLRHAQTEAAAALLSCKPEGLSDAVSALIEKQKMLESELAQIARERAVAKADALLGGAEVVGDTRLIAADVAGFDMNALREMAKRLIAEPDVVALLASGEQLLFARSEGLDCDMGKLMKAVTSAHGGRGGGRPEFAQGAAGEGALASAKQMTLDIIALYTQS